MCCVANFFVEKIRLCQSNNRIFHAMVFFVVWQLEKLFNSTTVYFDRLFCAGISCAAAVHTIMPKNERDLHSDATLIGILLG